MTATVHVPMYTPTSNGGHARYTHELLLALAEQAPGRGMAVSLVTTRNLDPAFRTSAYPIHDFLPPLKPRAAFNTVVGWAVSRMLFYWKREREFATWVEHNAAAVHVQEFTIWLAPLFFRRLRRRGIKVLATVHNVRWNHYPRLMPKWFADLCGRMMWQGCDALFVHTDKLRDELADNLGPKHPPIYVTPHGTWNGRSDALSQESGSVEERLAKKQLLFFGALTPYKGLHVLLDAFARLPKEYSLVIAGAFADDEYRDRIRAQVATLPEARICLIDRFLDESEIAPLFIESSLVVLPYVHFASQSGVLHDALAFGVPVVGTDVGALGESIEDWGIGEVVPAGDAVALADGIQAMFEPQTYRRAIAATEEVRTKRSWSATAAGVLDAYQAVICGNR